MSIVYGQLNAIILGTALSLPHNTSPGIHNQSWLLQLCHSIRTIK